MFQVRGKSPRMTAAERQRECRARKRGEKIYAQEVPCDQPPYMSPGEWERIKKAKAAAEAALPAAPELPALPAPPVTAIQQSSPRELAIPKKAKSNRSGDAWRLTLPPAVAARLQSLLERHDAGQPLTADERAEVQGLLDIAEFFIFHLRQRLAA